MNRAERRKQGLTRKEKVYTLTQSQLDSYVMRELAQRRNKLAEDLTVALTERFLMYGFIILHDKFGFGSKRLRKFYDEMNNLADSMNKEYCSDADVLESILEDIPGSRELFHPAYISAILGKDCDSK